jgi:hypothetical protein
MTRKRCAAMSAAAPAAPSSDWIPFEAQASGDASRLSASGGSERRAI